MMSIEIIYIYEFHGQIEGTKFIKHGKFVEKINKLILFTVSHIVNDQLLNSSLNLIKSPNCILDKFLLFHNHH
jgi:hypothetical protein